MNLFGWLKRSKLKREIIVNVENLETRVAVLENGRLEEFMVEHDEKERLVGSVFKGRVQNLENDLQAAFVDIGAKKNAFLHYKDMLPASYDILEDVRKAESENGNNQEEQSGKLLSKFAGKIRSLIGKADKTQRLKELEEKQATLEGDIVIDAYRREILEDNELGLGTSLFIASSRAVCLFPVNSNSNPATAFSKEICLSTPTLSPNIFHGLKKPYNLVFTCKLML